MDWYRKLDPKQRRLLLIGAGVLVAVVVVAASRRGQQDAAAAYSSPQGFAGGLDMEDPFAGGLGGSGAGDGGFADFNERLAGIETLIGDIPSLIAPATPAEPGDVPPAWVGQLAEALRPDTPTAPPAPSGDTAAGSTPAKPAAPGRPGGAAPPNATGRGRVVGPWSSAAARNRAVPARPGVRHFSQGNKFYAEIFDAAPAGPAKPAPVPAKPAPAPAKPAPAAPRPAPAPAPARPAPPPAAPPPNASGRGRIVGPWATAAMRNNAVPARAGVRHFSQGNKFYAEIF